jgi:UDP-N-acetylmuramate--alanine ligase
MATHYFNPVKNVHLVGIGGAGMSGIAEVLLHQGYAVTGSDINQNAMVKRLQDLGAIIYPEHHAQNVEQADILVTSTSIAADNPEVIAAKEARIPIISRAQMLADLMRTKHGIAVAGTHGKTTTTSLLASVLTEAGLDPTFVIGGLLKSAGAHAYLGKSQFFVAEADESDASFLYLYPELAIITNIDADHMNTYQNDFDCLKDAFVQFAHRLPFNGLAVVCVDDPVIQEILPKIIRPTLTYGFHSQADLQILDFKASGFQSCFTLKFAKDNKKIDITLNLPGMHNALNAAAVCGIANSLGVSDTAIQQALKKFAGVGRRMQVYGEFTFSNKHVLLIDDYGHHPREVAATWSAIRQSWPNRRLVVAYQPHRYTRTNELFADFVSILSQNADQLLLLDIYPAGENPIPGISGRALCDAIAKTSKTQPIFVSHIEELPDKLTDLLKDGDILLTQGAGSIGSVAVKLAEKWYNTI